MNELDKAFKEETLYQDKATKKSSYDSSFICQRWSYFNLSTTWIKYSEKNIEILPNKKSWNYESKS